MPSRRAAVAVLSAALLAGALAGGTAAATDLDPWRAFSPEAARVPTPTPTVTVTVTPRPAAEAQPVAPARFVTARFDVEGTPYDIDVPRGWKRVDQSERWHDFLDPTLRLRLRVRLDEHGDTAESAAKAAYAKRRGELAGFRSPGVDRVTTVLDAGTPGERSVTYYEFRYTSTEKEGARYGMEWYLDGSTMLGGFGWAGELELVEPAMARALESIVAGDDHA